MLYSPHPAGPPTTPRKAAARAIRALMAILAGLRRKRTQRLALRQLMEFDSARLDDLGIDRQDVIEALARSGDDRTRLLEGRRRRRAEGWSAPGRG